ncbi:calcium-translocating P-type ATPase [Lasiodiplodia theobromae]|uniref:Calcium-transporting ATPase n=1 Tax=Lasiodiplodia theobromae TaxID=45133 RepID=A0A5N5DP84_9PEZI|nr:Calcium-transporting ATPase 2 [Lasiodiplodia theobromae]KAF9633966.1 calcium-translocating P-type ATPase [Lasiodiplodia theobromae]
MEDEITPAAPTEYTLQTTTQALDEATFSLNPATEADAVPGNKFAFPPSHLQQLVTSRSFAALRYFGGLPGLSKGLRTDTKAGLGADEDIVDGIITRKDVLEAGNRPLRQDGSGVVVQSDPGKFTDRRHIYGENRVPKRKPTTFVQYLWLAFNHKLMFLLTASAIVSLALGIYQSVDDTEEGGIEWVEGVSIIVAVIVIVFVTAINDYQKSFKFQKLNQKKEERMVTVTRSGMHQSISIFDILVGDVLHIEAGDVVPADGVMIEGFDIQCDESALTGESELVVKISPHTQQPGDPFVFSGTKVVTGVGNYLALSVGVNSTYGKITSSLQDDVGETPLQQKLGVLANHIVRFGLAAGLIFFTIIFIRFLVQLDDIQRGPRAKAEEFLNVLILSITVVVIAVPGGLPLTVTLALAFATTRMLKDNNLVRHLRSCEIMGNATTVCSDKTGTLTQSKMTVVSGILGAFGRFDTSTPSNALSEEPKTLPTAGRLIQSLSADVRNLLKASFCLNSTAIETSDSNQFVGSSTETALLKFASDHLGMAALSEERANGNVVQLLPFDSKRKWMATFVKTGPESCRILVKGAAEVVLGRCTQTLQDPSVDMSTKILSVDEIHGLETTMHQYAGRSLRVVAVAYRDLPASALQDGVVPEEQLAANISDLVFLGAFGIRDPLRPEIVDSVQRCRSAGVFVRMVTGDNFFTAKAIASECGIYTAGGIAMDGPTFRQLTPEQLDLVVPRLQVLARSSPDDKMLLVSHLRSMGEIVAVTGDGTNDALALKAANVGLSMGISGTEVAREASDIILMDDNFASIVKAIGWGRAVNDAAKKFLQFQFTINITAGLLTVISALVGGTDASVFSVVQLLWINLIMDTFAALALATDFPTRDLFSRKPEVNGTSVLNTTMWKMITGQSIYQLAVIFVFYYAGESIFNSPLDDQRGQLQTMTFNTYVLMQFFNQANSRRADNKLNILEGVMQNPWFIFVQAVTLAGQIIIVFVGGQAFHTVPLTGAQWGWSILFGFLTIPLGSLIRLVPDQLVFKLWVGIEYCLPTRWMRHLYAGLVASLRSIFGFRSASRNAGSASAIGVNTQSDVQLSQQSNVPSDDEFDLLAAVEAVRFGTAEPHPTFEVHPDTQKGDPVLLPLRGCKVPPSQNIDLLRYIG